MSRALENVREFIESFRRWEGDQEFITITGEYNSTERVRLVVSDLQFLIDELDEAARLAREARKNFTPTG